MSDDELKQMGDDLARLIRAYEGALEVAGVKGPHYRPDGTMSTALTAMIVAHTKLEGGGAPTKEDIRATITEVLTPMSDNTTHRH